MQPEISGDHEEGITRVLFRGSGFSEQSNHNYRLMETQYARNVVTIASTAFGFDRDGTVSRYAKEASGRIKVNCPEAMRIYNTSMGGTDCQDQNINTYRITLCGKKWWLPVFTWLVGVSVQDGWLIGKNAGAKNCYVFLNFHRHVVNSSLGYYGV